MNESIYQKLTLAMEILNKVIKLKHLKNYNSDGTRKKLLEAVEEINKEYKVILPDEKLEYFKDQILAGLESDYAVSTATIKCKQFLFELSLGAVNNLKAILLSFKVIYATAFNKNREIINLFLTVGNMLEELNKSKQIFNKDFTFKTKLLESNRLAFSSLYNGRFFLNNSVVTVMKTIGKTANFLFLPEDQKKGSDVLHKLGISFTCNKLKYFVDQEDVSKYKDDGHDKLVTYDAKLASQQLEALPALPKSTDNDIIEYVQKQNTSFLTNTPDEPNACAQEWTTTINALISAKVRSENNWNGIKVRLQDLSNVKLTALEDMCTNLEDILRKMETEENPLYYEKVDDYLSVLGIGIMSYHFYLEFNSYDVQSFLIDLDYLLFYCNLLNKVIESYTKDISEGLKQQLANLKAQGQKLEEEKQAKLKAEEEQKKKEQQQAQQQAQQQGNTPQPNAQPEGDAQAQQADAQQANQGNQQGDQNNQNNQNGQNNQQNNQQNSQNNQQGNQQNGQNNQTQEQNNQPQQQDDNTIQDKAPDGKEVNKPVNQQI